MKPPAVELIPLDRFLMNLLLDNAASVYPGCTVATADLPALRDVVVQMKTFVEKNRIPPEWGGFLVTDAASRRVIGTCAFKGAPAPDAALGSWVEIAYFTFPSYERKGYATAMAQALVARAAASRRVETVIARTLPEKNASGRVLEKANFSLVGKINLPEDGTVWTWARRLKT